MIPNLSGQQSGVEAALPSIRDPRFSGYPYIRALRACTSARTAWETLHRTVSPVHITELALKHAELWEMHPTLARVFAQIYSSLLPVALRLRVVAGPFPTAAVYGSGLLLLPDPRIVRVDLNNSLVTAVGPNELRDLWDPKPRVLWEYVQAQQREATRAIRELFPNDPDPQNAPPTTDGIDPRYADAIYARTDGIWDPLMLMVVLIHEILHLCLEHTNNLVPKTIRLLNTDDPVILARARDILNVALDSHIHTLIRLDPWITLWLRMRDFPPCENGGLIVLDGKGQSEWGVIDHVGGDLPEEQNDTNLFGQYEVIQEGETGAQYTAMAYRERVFRTIREEAERDRQIGSAHAITEMLLRWERQQRRDLFAEQLTRFRTAIIETLSPLLSAESNAPDPTDRYLIRTGRVQRTLAARDDESLAIRLLVIIDSSGSVSDEEIIAAIESIRVALGGQGVCDAFFCDTEPMPIAMDIFTMELPDRVRAMSEIPRGGTSLGAAIRAYEDVFHRRLENVSAVVIITDGYNTDWAEDRLRKNQTPLIIGHFVSNNTSVDPPEVDYEQTRYVRIPVRCE